MKTTAIILGAALALAAASAQAAVVYAGPSAPQATDTSFTVLANSTGGSQAVSFILDGYLSLDGQNFYEDDFNLNVNGVDVFKGTFNLGGGGADAVYSNPQGAVATNLGNVFFGGGKEQISFSGLNLNAGSNTFVFSYDSLSSASGHAGFQGLGDEGWGVENVTIGTVPEPASWAMMLIGVAGLGAVLRTSRKHAVA